MVWIVDLTAQGFLNVGDTRKVLLHSCTILSKAWILSIEKSSYVVITQPVPEDPCLTILCGSMSTLPPAISPIARLSLPGGGLTLTEAERLENHVGCGGGGARGTVMTFCQSGLGSNLRMDLGYLGCRLSIYSCNVSCFNERRLF